VAEAAAAGAVVVSTEELLALVGSTGEASAVALSTAVPVSVGDDSPVAVAFVMAVLVGAITDSLMMSSSAASAFRGGGAGAIRTDITVTTITRTITTDTADIHMVTDIQTAMDTAATVTTVAPVMDIAMEADQDISGVGDKPGYASLKSPAC
jgi:hypothetical protein